METNRRTRLVCTIGPASAHRVADLVAAGMDVGRVNLSHGTPAAHEASVRAIRDAAEVAGRPVAVMVDLAGPKIRLGDLPGGSLDLAAGERLVLRPASEAIGAPDEATVTYPSIVRDLRAGDRVLLADGAAELRVTATDAAVTTEVVAGGVVRSGAGVAIPADRLSAPPLTARDLADLPRVVSLGVDVIAQSFVRSGADVASLRERLGPDGPAIVAKIETRPAIDDFDAILEAADAVMIARGDLGVELPFEEVPLVQKQLVRRALDRGVPTIVATQMLESMTGSPRPTRAEASDVANAVLDGADAIMLSGETAIGAYPVLAADAAVRIARVCEERGAAQLPRGAPIPPDDAAWALAAAAAALAGARPDVAAIAVITRTGRTARILSALRPRTPVVAFAADPAVARRLALVHGVVARTCPPPAGDEDPLATVLGQLESSGLVGSGRPVVVLASSGPPGSAPDVLAVRVTAGDATRARD